MTCIGDICDSGREPGRGEREVELGYSHSGVWADPKEEFLNWGDLSECSKVRMEGLWLLFHLDLPSDADCSEKDVTRQKRPQGPCYLCRSWQLRVFFWQHSPLGTRHLFWKNLQDFSIRVHHNCDTDSQKFSGLHLSEELGYVDYWHYFIVSSSISRDDYCYVLDFKNEKSEA